MLAYRFNKYYQPMDDMVVYYIIIEPILLNFNIFYIKIYYILYKDLLELLYNF